ncbi:MAG: glycosyltransferase [Phycisphaeraceae bacterium]|nr:glycosyltransferase [Phycisphaeraceae bacterium]
MRILMLGWEFPPFIAGGLGTACYGLTRALDRLGEQVLFVLPRSVDGETSSHVRLLSPAALATLPRPAPAVPSGSGAIDQLIERVESGMQEGFQRATFFALPAMFSSPYPEFAQIPDRRMAMESVRSLAERARAGDSEAIRQLDAIDRRSSLEAPDEEPIETIGSAQSAYGSDLVGDAHRYARLAVALSRRLEFDVIHAHDWLTYPAGIAVKLISGRPLVVHVHATEFDRSGEHVNRSVYDVERAGMHQADRVICVSALTKSICTHRYGVAERKVEIVYNGVEADGAQPLSGATIASGDKIVLFLGRITMQKGPEYFISAAKRVLEKMDNVKFLVAGSGDMALRMIDLAASLGIGHKVLFTGFLRGKDVERVFRMADCYVMPSVSEPFGIAALEAISHDVPVIISKQSGVSEVLTHALKVDFWDVDEMANKILAVLRYPPLGQTLRTHGEFELRGLTWDGAAERCAAIYRSVIEQTSIR